METPFKNDPSNTAAFKALTPLSSNTDESGSLKAVVLGGGTGAPVSIRTLISMGVETAAIVAMADDGGSTGILRKQIDATPPGDVRKCLAALASNAEDPFTQAFKYRLEFAQNHTLGNLIISALEDATGSFSQAISICEQLLGTQGHVYPSTLDRVNLHAMTQSGEVLYGQANACNAPAALKHVAFVPGETCRPFEPALSAIREADLIVLGPGSLFTSIIPNLLVPGVVEAIRESQGTTLFVCSLADTQGETRGLSVSEHVAALNFHGMEGLLDYVLMHATETLGDMQRYAGDEATRGYEQARNRHTRVIETENGQKTIYPVVATYEDVQLIQSWGTTVLIRDLVDRVRPTWHNPRALQDAFAGVIELCRLPQK